MRTLTFASLAALLFGLTGCSEAPIASDPNRAATILTEALDAWKKGEAPAALADRSNPIHIADHEWSNGYKLIGFTAPGEARVSGFDLTYPVVLELRGPRGKMIKKTAVYMVTTDPKSLVCRQEG